MRKRLFVSAIILGASLVFIACSGTEKSNSNGNQDEYKEKDEASIDIDEVEPDTKASEIEKAIEGETDKAAIKEATEPGTVDDTETAVDSETVVASGNGIDTKKIITTEISDQIPAEYSARCDTAGGTIEKISYTTYDYFGDKSEMIKDAYVYLPYGYDESQQYNVLYLMHGIGGDINEWGMNSDSSMVKAIMDNLAYKDNIDSFIIVTPNGRSSTDNSSSADYNSFYLFGQELRNDLIPYIDGHYSTYAEYSESGYDLTQARDHRAMAGLSMGGMQTINIGMCESLDIISYFGAFSACPTTYSASDIASKLKNYEKYDIHLFYSICGISDGVALASASNAVNGLTDLTDKLTENENYMWQEVPGAHDFNVWYLGFYNFAQLVFK